MDERPSITDAVLRERQELLRNAAEAKFCHDCCKGVVTSQQFNQWLQQAFLFMKALATLVSRALALAPYESSDVLGIAFGAIDEELAWFRVQAEERNIQVLDVEPHPGCKEFCQYVICDLEHQSFGAQYAAIFAVAYVFNLGWLMPGAYAAPYKLYGERWGGEELADLVSHMQYRIDDYLSVVSEEEFEEAAKAVTRVLQLFPGFWQSGES